MIIALSGLPRVGKDTFSDAVLSVDSNVISYGFADPFKKALSELFNWSIESFETDDKELIDPFWHISKRQAMEYLGTQVFRKDMTKRFPDYGKNIGDNIWVKRFELFYNQNKEKDIIIRDLRYMPEYKFLKEINACLILVKRPNYKNIDHSRSYDINSMNFNYVIENKIEGNIEKFKKDAIELYCKIRRS